MLHTPLCRTAGLPVVVCCRNLLRAPAASIIPCAIHEDTYPADVLVCGQTTAAAADDAANTFEIGIVRDRGVFPRKYTFSSACACYIREIVDGRRLVKNTRPPNCT